MKKKNEILERQGLQVCGLQVVLYQRDGIITTNVSQNTLHLYAQVFILFSLRKTNNCLITNRLRLIIMQFFSSITNKLFATGLLFDYFTNTASFSIYNTIQQINALRQIMGIYLYCFIIGECGFFQHCTIHIK